MGKKIKKAVKSVVKVVKKATVLGVGAKLLGGNKEQEAPDVAPALAAPPAAAVEAPKEDAGESDAGDTEAARKAARARGKRGLSVARASGTGLNI